MPSMWKKLTQRPWIPPPEEVKRQTLLEAWLSSEIAPNDNELNYDPLPTSEEPIIRLAQLLPGKDWEPIEVNFNPSTLDVEYEALSYTWGDAAYRSPIKCNGSRIDVTRNLKSALRDLRRPDRPRVLWIDAICINQNDIPEREQQVGIMREIYRGAQRTVIWLGETSAGSELAFDLLVRMEAIQMKCMEECNFDDTEKYFDLLYRNAIRPTFLEWDALYSLLKRPWFERMWVVQEVSLGKKALVTCGEQELDWEKFHDGVFTAFLLGLHGQEGQKTVFAPFFAMHQARSAFHSEGSSRKLGLLQLLHEFRVFNATTPQDKVIALLGLTNTDLNEKGIVPDYRCEPEEFFINVAKAFLRDEFSLDILSLPRGTTKLPLPSWAPDWSDTSSKPASFLARNKDYDHDDDTDFENPPTPFNASAQSVPSIPIFGADRSVKLHGHHITTIQTLLSVLPNRRLGYESMSSYLGGTSKISANEGYRQLFAVLGSTADQQEIQVKWDNAILGSKLEKAKNIYAPTGESVEVAYMRILCSDVMPNGVEAELESFREWRKERWVPELLHKTKLNRFKSLYKGLTRIGTLLPDNHESSFGEEIEHPLLRRFCFAENEYMGIVPEEAEVGDGIWLLKGCRIPLVLRARKSEDGGGFELVGDSMIHGIMYGEKYEEGMCEEVVLF